MRPVVALLAVLLVACPSSHPAQAPTDPYPPPGGGLQTFPDGSDDAAKSPCGQACANLKRVGCPEGGAATCYRACTRQASLERVPVACWISAHDQAAVRSCGPQLRCIP